MFSQERCMTRIIVTRNVSFLNLFSFTHSEGWRTVIILKPAFLRPKSQEERGGGGENVAVDVCVLIVIGHHWENCDFL